MKKILFILSILGSVLFSGNISADTRYTIDKQVYKADSLYTDSILHIAEVMPEFEGGNDEMFKYISSNLKYPITGQEYEPQGRVVLRFIVTKTGDIEQIKVLKSVSTACDREAIRVVESMPKWTPGKQNGKEVDVYFTIPILFRLR